MGCTPLSGAARSGNVVVVLLTTQLRVPAPPASAISRPRLLARVGSAPVTLVSGPVGAGKTTLLAEWAGQVDEPLAWVSLERETPLWPAISAALRPIVPAGWTLGGDGPQMVNAFAALPERVTLVIDDVHLARGGFTQLAFLLVHLPPTLRLVLAARSDPPLPFHVLRVRTTLAEIRAADLAFTSAEAGTLMAAHGLALDPRLTGVLHTRTEGWAAGLRMAALSLQRRDDPERFVAEFAGDDRLVSDFLVAEALDSLSSRERRFVLRTAVVSRLNGELAEAITGDGDGDARAARARQRLRDRGRRRLVPLPQPVRRAPARAGATA